MLMPKDHTKKIYEAIFEDGVMVAKKDVHLKKHQHPVLSKNNIPNLHVIQTMRSLVSRGYIKEQFAWRHYYWYLTNEGIVYLRTYLHLPEEVVPATLKVKRQETGGAAGGQRARLVGKAGEGGEGGERAYRPRQQQWGAGGGTDKDTGLSRDQPMEYRGGFGRGQRDPNQS